MKHLALALAALHLAAAPAAAGSLTLTSQIGAAPPQSYTAAIPDADMARIVAAYTATYFPQGVVVTPEVTCINVEPPCTPAPAVTRPPTSAELMERISSGQLAGMMAFVVSHEQQKAAEAARAAVAPITAVPAQ